MFHVCDDRLLQSSELPIVFGTYPANTTEHARLAALSGYVREQWMAFVKDPMRGLEWPRYFSEPAGDVLLVGNEGAVNGTVVSSSVVDYDCALYDQWIIAGGRCRWGVCSAGMVWWMEGCV